MAVVVVAEDDPRQADVLRAYLERDGHTVHIAVDGQDALVQVAACDPDLLLLDLMMPRLDGLGALRALRAVSDLAVIVVSARAEEASELLGFELGADDYITKPYGPRQLMARVRAVLRRSGPATDAVLEVGDVRVDRDRCEVRVAGRLVELTSRELNLLEVLAQQPGRVFSRQQLLEEIAGLDSDALDRTIDMHVMNLRRKIEPDPTSPRYVLTVTGRGYKLAGEHKRA